jgi:hypothetical protein
MPQRAQIGPATCRRTETKTETSKLERIAAQRVQVVMPTVAAQPSDSSASSALRLVPSSAPEAPVAIAPRSVNVPRSVIAARVALVPSPVAGPGVVTSPKGVTDLA